MGFRSVLLTGIKTGIESDLKMNVNIPNIPKPNEANCCMKTETRSHRYLAHYTIRIILSMITKHILLLKTIILSKFNYKI